MKYLCSLLLAILLLGTCHTAFGQHLSVKPCYNVSVETKSVSSREFRRQCGRADDRLDTSLVSPQDKRRILSAFRDGPVVEYTEQSTTLIGRFAHSDNEAILCHDTLHNQRWLIFNKNYWYPQEADRYAMSVDGMLAVADFNCNQTQIYIIAIEGWDFMYHATILADTMPELGWGQGGWLYLGFSDSSYAIRLGINQPRNRIAVVDQLVSEAEFLAAKAAAADYCYPQVARPLTATDTAILEEMLSYTGMTVSGVLSDEECFVEAYRYDGTPHEMLALYIGDGTTVRKVGDTLDIYAFDLALGRNGLLVGFHEEYGCPECAFWICFWRFRPNGQMEYLGRYQTTPDWIHTEYQIIFGPGDTLYFEGHPVGDTTPQYHRLKVKIKK